MPPPFHPCRAAVIRLKLARTIPVRPRVHEGKDLAETGAPHRARRARLCGAQAGRADRSPPSQTRAGAARPVPDRFRQRAGARPLYAAVLAARALSAQPARRQRRRPQAAAVRILGARGLAAADRDLSADALAHAAGASRASAPMARWRGSAARGRTTSSACSARSRPTVRSPPPASRASKGAGGWWGWSDAKHAFEWLFWAGRITTASREGFQRYYDLPERVLPKAIVEAPEPSAADAHRELLRHSARALGVATISRSARLFPAVAGRREGPHPRTGRGR